MNLIKLAKMQMMVNKITKIGRLKTMSKVDITKIINNEHSMTYLDARELIYLQSLNIKNNIITLQEAGTISGIKEIIDNYNQKVTVRIENKTTKESISYIGILNNYNIYDDDDLIIIKYDIEINC
jgi:hypothetical protein